MQKILDTIKKVPAKIWAIGAGALVAIIVLIVVLVAVFSAGAKEKYTVYMKDGELYLSWLNGKDSIEITSRFLGDSDEDSASYMAYSASALIKLSADGKTIFYPDRFDESTYTFDLYYRSATNTDAEEEKIASGVYDYYISPNNKTIIYINEKGLYEYDFKDDEKIDSDIYSYWVAEDCKSVVYTTEDGDLYRWEHGKDSDKLEANVEVAYVSEDLSTIYFQEDEELYVLKGDDKEKIDENIEWVMQGYENGAIYYLKANSQKTTMADYIIDDYAASDALMEKPEYPDFYSDYELPIEPEYPYWWDYATDEEYNQAYAEYEAAYTEYVAACEVVYNQYYADVEEYERLMDEWYEKSDRDYYREYFEVYEFSTSSLSLYYYDGKKSVEVVDNIDYEQFLIGQYEQSFNDPVVLFYVVERGEVEKIRIEEIEDFYTTYSQIEEALSGTYSLAIALEGECEVIDEGIMETYTISLDGKNVYYLKDVDENNEGTLYKVSVDGKIGEAKEYDSNVSANVLYTLDNGEVVYFKDFDEDDEYTGTLYINKEKIEKDVSTYIVETKEAETYYFIADVKNQEGTLCYYKDGEVEEIQDDVYEYSIAVTPEGGVLYLVDYSDSKQRGDLYYFVNGKEGTEIDEDVTAIVVP